MPHPKAASVRSGPAQGRVIPRQPTRPLHLHPGYLLLAFLGGTAGTAARAGVGLAIPGGGVPYATLAVNIVGAFVLAALLTTLARRAPGGGHRARILFGTGAMGGFTTYSAFATDLVGLLDRGSVGAAIGYGLATVLVGGLASWAGIAAAAALHDRSRAPAGSRAPGDKAAVGRLGSADANSIDAPGDNVQGVRPPPAPARAGDLGANKGPSRGRRSTRAEDVGTLADAAEEPA